MLMIWCLMETNQKRNYEQREGMTLQEVANELGFSHQYIKRVEQKALRKLRRFCDEQGISIRDLIDV